MTHVRCLWAICFVPLDGKGPKLFGYPEFLAGLALMVLAWTIADARYRFRVMTAPLPLRRTTYFVVAIVGVLTLLTDLWRAEQWLVPNGNLISPTVWQAILAAAFLLTFLTWAWFAFIRPPIYGKRNARWYAWALYQNILKGVPNELVVVAEELIHSAKALVRYASDGRPSPDMGAKNVRGRTPLVEGLADDLLLLIGDRRFCRTVVESSPATALAIFQEMSEQNKYAINIGTFGKNIVGEAIANKDSFLYNEAEGYDSGLIGYHKPLSQAMFSNYRMVETIGTLLDPHYQVMARWDAEQWEAYCRVVLLTFQDYVEKGAAEHSYVLFRAKGYIENSVSDLYKLNGVAGLAWDNDIYARLRVVVDFIADAIEILGKKPLPPHLQLRVKGEHRHLHETFYDHLARMICEVIFHASSVASPWWECWNIQHNLVWDGLFESHKLANVAGKVVMFKVRRQLYDEVARMSDFPNFKGAKILAFCLNVMGLREGKDEDRGRALHKAVLAWTRKNYVWLHKYNFRVAETCLVANTAYDEENCRLVKTSPAEGLRREAHYVYLELDPAKPETPGDG
ncbi:hypothetical protein [Dyella sp. SG609]|uniref:hypothetical protein n=1 Tax=Dyella sp. SG609 TaxID=2587018 RepID=UPI0017DDAEA1|nr:hypothetical protein [Dyella sp. SG609]NKJ21961.1 putative membrane protein [Dyella sp. SG609]